MERVEALKCLAHPGMAFLLVAAWIAFIGGGIVVPLEFEALAVTVAGTWALKRSYKTYKEVVNKVQEE